MGPCPMDCEGNWGAWSECPVSCGVSAVQTRFFEVTTTARFGGACPLQGTSQTQDCNTDPCALDCEGNFTDWTSCSAACDGGTQTRSFVVTSPAM